jgi:3-dehydroquinate synthase class II
MKVKKVLLNTVEKKLAELRDEKKKLIEEVKDKETFKVACEILERFSDTESIPDKNPIIYGKIPFRVQKKFHSVAKFREKIPGFSHTRLIKC